MLDGKHNIYIHKGVTVRFGFDGRRTSQTHRQVKNKATGTSHGVYYILYALIGLLCVFHSEARGVTIYSHLRGAFSVARFDLSGNAKAFLSWNEQQNWLHAFYLYKSTTTLLINAYNGALVQKLNKHE